MQANILLTNELNIVLADFGLAVFAEGVKNQYASLHGGAFQWLPPEAFSDVEDFRPTFSADIYAFACVCIALFRINYLGMGMYCGWYSLQLDVFCDAGSVSPSGACIQTGQ